MKREDLGRARVIIDCIDELDMWQKSINPENPDVSITIMYKNLRATIKGGTVLSESGFGLSKMVSKNIEIAFLYAFQELVEQELGRLKKELDSI
jgi:hypothetical protein